MEPICGGLNVLELGAGSAAAAIAGVVLADAGARVLKIEPPEGDRLRSDNPSGFLVWNRGKESLVADLRTPEGQQTVRDLAAKADVVIEGFAPGTTSAWGIGADDLRALNPALIHCSITGFGKTGPYSALKGYDSLIAAKAGLWARGAFGHREGPIMFPVPWASFGAGMQSAAGILGALLVRESTGRGQALDSTLFAGLDPIDYFVATVVQVMAKRGEKPSGDARAATSASRFGVLLVTRDGRFIQTSTMLPHQGRALCEVAGIAHVLDDPKFKGLPTFANADDAQEWEDLLLEAFRAKDFDHWLPLLQASPDVAFEVAVTSEEGMKHPQIAHNGDVVSVEDPVLGTIRQVGPVGHFEKTPIGPQRSAPALGDNAGPLAVHEFPTGGGAAPKHPFEGVTVVEFGSFYAMPYGTAMLAALGARVIKIEDGNGDPHRNSFGPEVATNKTTAAKESLSLNLRTPEGRAIAQQVIAKADVFVNSFRTGVAERLGLGYEELSALNPRLLYVHAAGYGTDGPYAKRALYAQAAQTVAGSFGRQVGYWVDPAQSEGFSVMELQAVVLPRLNMMVDGDSNAALAVLAALSLGIYHQRRTGTGQFMRTSMIGGNAWAYADDFCTYDGKPATPLCDSEYYGTSALDRVYQAAEGWVCLAVKTDAEFATLVRTFGLPELETDARFATAEARKANNDELETLLAAKFAERPAGEWEKELTAAGVGCVEANLMGQPIFTVFDPVLRETGLTVAFDHPVFGEMVRAAPPVTFSETPGRVAPPCQRGEHNRAILAELGYSEADIAKFEELNAVVPQS
ncbi:CoA transferase [Mycolicibacterium flavescens]|uniref:CoA-transferase n=1 Tax=Mycolicibacterium flavescens TaxID=1776 RepID=A0A1E3RDJ4_MYCFV|nr:CoA transferase [Mycolicibacterium flavescens]MCV7282396.1 CoA transferase [Mycolicibacterium flavescens]ODQ87919.1 CoA-transferase [Mycolicibacterium flavescens]